MAFYGRRYRRYRRYKRFYRRYRRGHRSYARKYVNATSRSSVRLRFSVEDNFELASGTAAAPGAVKEFCALKASNVDGSALKSPLYRTYCSLYEECKVIGFKCQISIASVIGGADIPSLQIYTAIDRKHGATEPAITAAEIKQSSSYLVSTALNNNVAKITRSCYASDLMEKATWHDCSLAEDATHTFNFDQAYNAAGLNPGFFVPCLAMCFQAPTLAASVNVKVNVSTVYYFAFRNPKYGGGNAASTRVQDLGGVFRGPANPDDGGDMDDGQPINLVEYDDGDDDDDPPAAAAAAPVDEAVVRPRDDAFDRGVQRKRARVVPVQKNA